MNDWPWIFGAVAMVAWFAFFETVAFKHPDRINTLSRAVSTVGERWPFSIFLIGFMVGALAAHFFWAWNSNPLAGGG